MIRALAALVIAFACLAPGRAFAHPLIDEARAAYDRARYDRALELLEEAEQASDLTRDDLVELLLLSANAHRRQREMELVEVDLTRLASLDPERDLGRRVHPAIRRVFDRVTERVSRPVHVEATAEREGSRVEITAAVTDDIAALTQGFRLHGRAEGGTWEETNDSTLTVRAEPQLAVEYWVEAIGPGGAPIATHGSAAEPLRVEAEGETGGGAETTGGGETAGGGSATGGASGGGGGGDDDEGVPAWPFVVGGVALVAIAAVVLGVYFGTQPTDDTQLGRPRVESLVSAPRVLLTFD